MCTYQIHTLTCCLANFNLFCTISILSALYANVASWTVSTILATEDYNSFRITCRILSGLTEGLSFPDTQFWRTASSRTDSLLFQHTSDDWLCWTELLGIFNALDLFLFFYIILTIIVQESSLRFPWNENFGILCSLCNNLINKK